MHGCSLGSAPLVNAEVDSMGGVVDGGVGIGTKTSPCQAAIEKAQAELRQEYDVRQEKRRELEFLEKGGNPLDFKLGNAASVSIQSTSLTDQPLEQIVTSEAKDSFAWTASPHGDSVESIGRPGAPASCEPNSADNLLLFDGESEFLDGEKNCTHSTQSYIAPSEQPCKFEGTQNVRESRDSSAFGLPKNQAYKRRNRSRPNRDGARSSSVDMVPSRGGHVSSLPSCNSPKEAKSLVIDVKNQRDHNVSSNGNLKPTIPNGSVVPKTLSSDGPLEMLDNDQVNESTGGMIERSLPKVASDFSPDKGLQDNRHNPQSQVDPQEALAVSSGGPESVNGGEQLVSVSPECPPCVAAEITKNLTESGQLNGYSNARGDRESIKNESRNSRAAFSKKGLGLETSCNPASVNLEGNNDNYSCSNIRTVVSNRNVEEQSSVFAGAPNIEGQGILEEKNDKKADGYYTLKSDEQIHLHKGYQHNGSTVGPKEELDGTGCGSQNELKDPVTSEGMEVDDGTVSGTKPEESLADHASPQKGNGCTGTVSGSMDSSVHDNSNPQKENTCTKLQDSVGPIHGLPETILCGKGSADANEQQTSSETRSTLVIKAQEDSILEEAQIIEAKHKRIAELSAGTLPVENHRKSYWDFVLEEMVWLANDFAQERCWKISIAAQVCHRVASTSRLRFQEQNLLWRRKRVAHTIAKAVTEFWHSAEEMNKESEMQYPGRNHKLAVAGYAMRFLKYNNSSALLGLSEKTGNPDSMSDLSIQEIYGEDHFTEENLFYKVPPGSMESYKISIESHLAQVGNTTSGIQEEVETSIYDAAADNAYDEDEDETSNYYTTIAFESSKPSKIVLKKRKNLRKAYTARPYNLGRDSLFIHYTENRVGAQQSALMGKRPANNLNVGVIPTKRSRTASRQRLSCPFNAASSGGIQGPNRTDASSGDTNSFQDDQSTLHIPNSLEFESVDDFEKKLPFESIEVSKPKKKKKPHYLGSAYEHRFLDDNNFQNEQRDHLKKRLEGHQLESNASSGLFGQSMMKKRKMMRQSLDDSYDNHNPVAGPTPSPVASQMSNMANPNKLMKFLGGRDRGRKGKSLKMLAGQQESGSPWSLFEDQALVVIVHDMGPNWELVSDAINSTLEFKCIFRKPSECKERHKILMDRTGDGTDSAEDSGSSQPYPSTLPGIPKGSARQLFQRLQGPMEEDMVKSHFEKIIMILQKLHHRRTQNDNQNPKQIQPHNSHTYALSQVCPNNSNGGPPLTPLDLCDTTASSPDVLSLGYQGSPANNLATANQGTVAPALPAAGANSLLQATSNMILGNSIPSSSGPLNTSVRDGRHPVPRSASFTMDEQQRIQYNQMFSGRNVQHSGLSVSGTPPGTDRGVRVLPGGNGMCGASRSMPMAKPCLQGVASSSMLNSGNTISSGMVALPSNVNMHSGVGSGQGHSMLRSCEALNIIRPGQNPDHQRPLVVPDLQMQAQGNSHGVPPYGGLSSAFSNQTSSPPTQTYPLQQQLQQQQQQQMSAQSHVMCNPLHPHLQGSNHASSTQNQAYAVRFGKERQLQQRLLQQQQQHQQFAMPHVQPRAQLPISSLGQNNSIVQPQISAAMSLPLTQSSPRTPKLHMPPHVLNRNHQTGGSGLSNQMGKQRQCQQQQQQQLQLQSGRHHPQKKQQSQLQQQPKLNKEVGQGNVLVHQNVTNDPPLSNGIFATPSSQSTEKAEQAIHLMHGQSLYPGPGVNSAEPPKSVMPHHRSNQPHHQQKIYPEQSIAAAKQVQQLPSYPDNSTQGQAVPSSIRTSSYHQQLPLNQKLVNHTQLTMQRLCQQNRQLHSDPTKNLLADQAQVGQQPMSNSSQMSITVIPQQSTDPTATISVVSSSAIHWKAPAEIYDSDVPNPATQLAPPSVKNSSGSQPMATQGLEQVKSPSSLPLRQQQQSPQQQSQQQTVSASREQQFVYQTH
ncbi:Nucleoplasmin ATPase [Bertholletia excelsa]